MARTRSPLRVRSGARSGVVPAGEPALAGRDGATPLPGLPLDTGGDVIAQLSNDAGGQCWESRFPAANVRDNDTGLFDARIP